MHQFAVNTPSLIGLPQQKRAPMLLQRNCNQTRVAPGQQPMWANLATLNNAYTLSEDKQVDPGVITTDHARDIFLRDHLLHMYLKRGSLEDARKMFDRIRNPSVVLWTAMIAANTRHGHCKEALQLFQQMQLHGVIPDKVAFITILNACTSPAVLEEGKQIHAQIVQYRYDSDVVVGNAIINMYTKCGSLENATGMFKRMQRRDVVSWTAMIAACNQYGQRKEAIELFQHMQLLGIMPNKVTFIALLNACARQASLAEGKLIHAHIIQAGFGTDVVLGNAIVNMYGKCGSLEDAHRMFCKMPQKNVVSWTSLIATYVQHGHCKEALHQFQDMQVQGVMPNKITFIIILNACGSPKALAEGKLIHALVIHSGLESDVVVATALITMYGKCGSIEDAHLIFNKFHRQNVALWNALIAAYAQNGHCNQAHQLFRQMQVERVILDKITLITIVNVCASMADLLEGKLIHSLIIESGFESDVVVGTALVNMYGRCGSSEDARRIFDNIHQRDVAMWNAMIGAYAQHDRCNEALQIYYEMQLEDVMPDKITYVTLLNACASVAALPEGKLIHAHILKNGFKADVALGNAIIQMYGKCGSLENARRSFDKMHKRNVVSWDVMIAAYAQHGLCKEALLLFQQMQLEGLMPDMITFVTVLNACASLAALVEGKLVHGCITESGFELDVVLGTALVNMYGKCGSLEDARTVFDKICERDVVLWSAMIAAYSQHGHGKEALQLFGEMQQEDVKPDDITFTSILSACSHAGLVDEGWHYFSSMCVDHGITPTGEHYGCMVDLFGRAGRLKEAEHLINKMPHKFKSVAWMTLLGACRIHGDTERAKCAAEHILKSDPQNTAAYAVLSNIYAAAGKWDDAAKVRKVMMNQAVNR